MFDQPERVFRTNIKLNNQHQTHLSASTVLGVDNGQSMISMISWDLKMSFRSHRIHGAGIYANIGGILMVNVTIYSIQYMDPMGMRQRPRRNFGKQKPGSQLQCSAGRGQRRYSSLTKGW